MTQPSNMDTGSNNEEQLQLLERVADGDKHALTQLYLQYHARLFKFVFRLTRSYTIADELVNDVMLVVWEKAGSFRGESRVSTWIFGIAYRQAMRRVTRKGIDFAPMNDASDPNANQENVTEIENWVEKGLHTLPESQRMTVILVFYLGLTYEETAAMTECPVNTVKTRMFHARRKLKEYLAASAVPAKMTGESGNE
ncbi:MAG: sigma-70 family RNA polymerase sigma factor [Woeseiaceae bacterium]|nr:sigma-70 family RNA polymerase sigma factor [Woeseiaceae bacterium]